MNFVCFNKILLIENNCQPINLSTIANTGNKIVIKVEILGICNADMKSKKQSNKRCIYPTIEGLYLCLYNMINVFQCIIVL